LDRASALPAARRRLRRLSREAKLPTQARNAVKKPTRISRHGQEPTTMTQKDNERRTSPSGGVTAGAADASLRRLLPFAWPLFTAMWLLFPIGSVVEMLRTDLTPLQLLTFLASLAAFVAVFLWLMLRYPFRDAELAPPERRIQLGLLVALVALALYLEVAYGSGIPYHLNFVVIAAAVTLPTLHAALTVVAVTLAVSGIYAVRSGWEAIAATWQSAVAPFVIVGFSMIIVSRLVVTVRELRTARKEIARLAVAEERLRFARDLHDLLGHSLSLITLKSELARRLLPTAPEKAAAEVRDVEGVARGRCARYARQWPVTGGPRSTRSCPAPARCWKRPVSPAGSSARWARYRARLTPSWPGPCARGRRTSSATAARSVARSSWQRTTARSARR
jgi:Histidine kinase